ncbi:MAG: DUF1778 domain-containing protein [Thainema sp.]
MVHTANKRSANSTKDDRINIRAQKRQTALINRAAALENKTFSDFVLEAACSRAEDILLDKSNFFVDESQWDEFVSVLDAPPRALPQLKALLDTPSPWE